jgi:hypothetical protein
MRCIELKKWPRLPKNCLLFWLETAAKFLQSKKRGPLHDLWGGPLFVIRKNIAACISARKDRFF